jgi:GTP-dependent phosphoenolpyruvate carboxykinase
MSEVQKLQKGLIDKIQSIQDKERLEMIHQLIDSSKTEEILTLTEEQEEVLRMSEEDIEAGRTISQQDLDKDDIKWPEK